MAEPSVDQTRMPLGNHLEELRRRLILGLLGVAAAAMVTMIFGIRIVEILCRPLLHAQQATGLEPRIYVTRITAPFMVYVKVSLIGGLILGSPWLIHQLWKFVSVGLYHGERRVVVLLAPFSAVMAILGILFMYYLMLPVCLQFFITFMQQYGKNPATGQPTLVDIYELGPYISFVLLITLGIVVAFQLPVVMLVLSWSGAVDPAWLAKYRRHCIFACCFLGAALTPADPLSMVLLAIPLYALFELGLLLMRRAYRRLASSTDADHPESPLAGEA